LVTVALHAGLRRQNQFQMRWEHVDFTNGWITVLRSKSGEAYRVHMNDTLRETLRALPNRM
jgi:integrase